jgi:hypothetical protein
MRSDNQNACAGTVQATNIKAIVRYSTGPSTGLPTTAAYNYTGECVDEPYDKLVPYVALDAAAEDTIVRDGPMSVVIGANDASLFKWYLGGTTFFSEYNDPTLLDIWQNNTTPDYSGNLLINVPGANQMVYVGFSLKAQATTLPTPRSIFPTLLVVIRLFCLRLVISSLLLSPTTRVSGSCIATSAGTRPWASRCRSSSSKARSGAPSAIAARSRTRAALGIPGPLLMA